MGSFFSNPSDQCLKESSVYENKGTYSLFSLLLAVFCLLCMGYVFVQPSETKEIT